MGTRLLQIVTFLNVAPAASLQQPHGINIAGTQYRPDFVAGDQTDFSVVVTDTTVTVTNNGGVPASINVWLELKHTIPRELGGGIQNMTPQPFYVLPGVGSAAPAITVTSQWTAIVDPALGDDATGTFGNLALAFKTIQAALNAIPTPVDGATARTAWTILVSPGTYDESLTVDLTGGKHVTLASWGPWNLGLFNGADWTPSGPARSINLVTTGAGLFDFINGSFSLQPMLPVDTGDETANAQHSSVRISGQITGTGIFAGTPKIDVNLSGCVVFGIAGAAIVAGPESIGLRVLRSRMRGTVVGAQTELHEARETRFDQLVDIIGYGRLSQCFFGDGMTIVGTSPSSNTVPGFYDCQLSGVFTGPVGFNSYWFDEVTSFWFKANLATFAVGTGRNLVELINPMPLPEQWAVQNVAASVLVPVPMSAQVSTNFDDLMMLRPGSIVGMMARLTEALTAGTIEVEITIDGIGVGAPGRITLSAPTNGDALLIPIGTLPYLLFSRIGVQYTSSAGLAPLTSDLEVWLEVVEEIP